MPRPLLHRRRQRRRTSRAPTLGERKRDGIIPKESSLPLPRASFCLGSARCWHYSPVRARTPTPKVLGMRPQAAPVPRANRNLQTSRRASLRSPSSGPAFLVQAMGSRTSRRFAATAALRAWSGACRTPIALWRGASPIGMCLRKCVPLLKLRWPKDMLARPMRSALWRFSFRSGSISKATGRRTERNWQLYEADGKNEPRFPVRH